MDSIGILTSGGDAPGMNAAIRAIVRSSVRNKIRVYGFKNGFDGLIESNYKCLTNRSVGNIIQKGGSILFTSRSKKFLKKNFRKKAYLQTIKLGVKNLIIIGGDGTIKGGIIFSKEFKDINVIALPATIDRDVPSDLNTIGFDTAMNTAMEAIDKIRDTATTSNIIHIIEVMGRECGSLAISSGLSGGAEAVIVPEKKTNIKILVDKIYHQLSEGKKGCILIIAEGALKNGARTLIHEMKVYRKLDIRVTTLGHVQRGGNPTAYDRILGSELGYHAVKCLMSRKKNIIISKTANLIEEIKFSSLKPNKKSIDKNFINLINYLS